MAILQAECRVELGEALVEPRRRGPDALRDEVVRELVVKASSATARAADSTHWSACTHSGEYRSLLTLRDVKRRAAGRIINTERGFRFYDVEPGRGRFDASRNVWPTHFTKWVALEGRPSPAAASRRSRKLRARDAGSHDNVGRMVYNRRAHVRQRPRGGGGARRRADRGERDRHGSRPDYPLS